MNCVHIVGVTKLHAKAEEVKRTQKTKSLPGLFDHISDKGL